MWRVWEHIHRLHPFHPVILVEQGKVSSLRGRIATHIDYTSRSGFQVTRTTSSCMPARGGSVMIMSGRPYWLTNSSVSTVFISPAKNVVLPMPLRLLFTLASSIASGTNSMPITCLALRATKLAMVPVPVYKS